MTDMIADLKASLANPAHAWTCSGMTRQSTLKAAGFSDPGSLAPDRMFTTNNILLVSVPLHLDLMVRVQRIDGVLYEMVLTFEDVSYTSADQDLIALVEAKGQAYLDSRSGEISSVLTSVVPT
jgi:hypothetical protein